MEKPTRHLHSGHDKEQNSYKLSKEWYFCLTNCRNYIQKQTKVSPIVSKIDIVKTLTSTAVGMKLFLRCTLNSVINTT
jgi:hypothetical protein